MFLALPMNPVFLTSRSTHRTPEIFPQRMTSDGRRAHINLLRFGRPRVRIREVCVSGYPEARALIPDLLDSARFPSVRSLFMEFDVVHRDGLEETLQLLCRIAAT